MREIDTDRKGYERQIQREKALRDRYRQKRARL